MSGSLMVMAMVLYMICRKTPFFLHYTTTMAKRDQTRNARRERHQMISMDSVRPSVLQQKQKLRQPENQDEQECQSPAELGRQSTSSDWSLRPTLCRGSGEQLTNSDSNLLGSSEPTLLTSSDSNLLPWVEHRCSDGGDGGGEDEEEEAGDDEDEGSLHRPPHPQGFTGSPPAVFHGKRRSRHRQPWVGSANWDNNRDLLAERDLLLPWSAGSSS